MVDFRACASVLVALFLAIAGCDANLLDGSGGTAGIGASGGVGASGGTGGTGGQIIAPSSPCTDGVDCRCDRLRDPTDPLYDPDLIFCEDFEDPGLDRENGGAESTWSDVYAGNGASHCSADSQPFTIQEGTCEQCCLNVVQEGACDVAGEDDCVFDGLQTMGHRLRPGRTGGIFGRGSWDRNTAQFGVTYAMRYAPNFVDPSPAMKTNEFGDADACLLGCSTFNCTSQEVPFVVGSIRFQNPISTPFANVIRGGECAISDGYSYKWFSEDYKWGNPKQPGDDFGPGEWGCFRMHWSGWGTSSASLRYWFNDKLLMHITDIDMSDGYWDPNNNRFYPDKAGLGHHRWNHYYNDGYKGSTTSYRWEDNFVVTAGSEPVSCEAIGFTFD